MHADLAFFVRQVGCLASCWMRPTRLWQGCIRGSCWLAVTHGKNSCRLQQVAPRLVSSFFGWAWSLSLFFGLANPDPKGQPPTQEKEGPTLSPRRKGQPSLLQELERHIYKYLICAILTLRHNREPSHPSLWGRVRPHPSLALTPPLQDRAWHSPFFNFGWAPSPFWLGLPFTVLWIEPSQPRPEGPTPTPRRKGQPSRDILPFLGPNPLFFGFQAFFW